ncbi:DUF3738 domain-containing protein [Pedobacter chinensis]|uniref:DUF3738 domain-containing protein n=1 Tax=Pedobacter chinensis TaxID=2282421 RepID=A0A369Q1U7_9SPHI|nr:redoxin domain-containing protein [Pedobacter chinensis]RDC56986.1 DUF3738 domain-containing protein [Pedobacter chinensis]
MMKAILFNLLFSAFTIGAAAQGLQIKTGDQFPDIPVRNLINAPVVSIQLSKPAIDKIYILNFWGTWCSPCIPEMDSLARLQKQNEAKIQVIGISDDTPSRLANYLKNKPSKIWLSSDTSGFFYQLFALAYVGQSAIINSKGKVVALVRTDSINQKLITRLIKGEIVKSSAALKEKAINNNDDIFGVDSTLNSSFTLRGYMVGQQSMSKRYILNGAYKNRRITFVNSSAESMYRAVYGIVAQKQIAYEVPEKEVSDFDNKQSLYCLDLLVKAEEKDSLYNILQQRLQQFMPVKARIEYREMPVYALVNKNFNQKESAKENLSYGFSGRGYDGVGATLANFANDYLSNELGLPVVDETGLTQKYDIKTNVEVRTKEGIVKSLTDIGLELFKKEKKMKVLVFYK